MLTPKVDEYHDHAARRRESPVDRSMWVDSFIWRTALVCREIQSGRHPTQVQDAATNYSGINEGFLQCGRLDSSQPGSSKQKPENRDLRQRCLAADGREDDCHHRTSSRLVQRRKWTLPWNQTVLYFVREACISNRQRESHSTKTAVVFVDLMYIYHIWMLDGLHLVGYSNPQISSCSGSLSELLI